MSDQLNISPAQLDTLLAEDTVTPGATGIQKKRPRLTDFEKGKIILLYEQGWGYGRIASNIGRTKSTVQNFINRYVERESHVNKPHPGREKKISQSTEDAVLALIQGDASISKMKITETIPELQDIHPRTLDRMLRGKGIRKWIAWKRPKLLPRHATARLACAIERKDWTLDQWKRFIWSYECSVERSKGAGAKWVWRTRGEDRYTVEAVDPCRYVLYFHTLINHYIHS